MPHLAEYMGLARVLLAQRRTEKAVSLLERLQALTVQTGQHVIRVQILLALAYQQHSSVPDAITMLEKALRRAEPEGIISRFVQEGEPMAVLLNKVLRSRARTGSLHDYTKRLLALIEPHSRHESSQDEDFLEAFSPRELEILSLISEGLPNGAIARELAINESTVKTHINNLYSKLGVHSRTLALRRARELDLL
jgi:LuxR family transcriptional regulator, maltose regulon positive regulatory protein